MLHGPPLAYELLDISLGATVATRVGTTMSMLFNAGLAPARMESSQSLPYDLGPSEALYSLPLQGPDDRDHFAGGKLTDGVVNIRVSCHVHTTEMGSRFLDFGLRLVLDYSKVYRGLARIGKSVVQ